jgi:polycomb protein EED
MVPKFPPTTLTHHATSIRFYGDYIFTSEANFDAQNGSEIVLWRLDDLDSHDPLPTPADAPVPPPAGSSSTAASAVIFTRSWKGGAFQRILSLYVPSAPYYGRRFSLFASPGKRPVLATGNLSRPAAQLLFWDLQRLEEEAEEAIAAAAAAVASSATAATTAVGDDDEAAATPPPPPQQQPRQSKLADRFRPIEAHKALVLDGKRSHGRPGATRKFNQKSMFAEADFKFHQAAWSVGGEWCVFSSDNGFVCTTRRWI